MDIKWVKIRSWHAVRPPDPGFGLITPSVMTYCGREASNEPVDELPDEKSCESCLRIVARIEDE